MDAKTGCNCYPLRSFGDWDYKMLGCGWCDPMIRDVCKAIKEDEMGYDGEMVMVAYDSIIRNTGEGGATLFEIDGEEKWIPNSLIEEVWEKAQEVEIPRWFAEKEELI